MKLVVTILTLGAAFGSVWVPAILGQNEEPAQEEEAEQAESEQVTERERDPVCNIVVQRNPELSAEYRGKTYYFCMKTDMEAFKKDPEKYLQGEDHSHPDLDS